jgi:hypothetical protein
MQITQRIRKKCGNALTIAVVITMLLGVSLSVSGCFQKRIQFIPQNELGEIDYYGELLYGEIPPEVLERIKDKKVEIVSKGFVYRYWEMKKLLKDLDEWKWED